MDEKENGFQALLGVRREEYTQNLRRGGLEAELEFALHLVERATAKAIAIRAIISQFPELVQKEREYRTLVSRDKFYPVSSTREFTPICGCCADTELYHFGSQAEFESTMDNAISLRGEYNSAQRKCSEWEANIRREDLPSGEFNPNAAVEPRQLRERLIRAQRIGSEATFVIPELMRFLDEDIKTYLQSAKMKGFDASKYDGCLSNNLLPKK